MLGSSSGRSGVIPCLRYRDAPAAIEWLGRVFGLVPRLVVPNDDGSIGHAQLTLGSGMVMLGSVVDSGYGRLMKHPDQIGGFGTQGICLIVDDADAVHARATEAGASIVLALKDEDYGGRGFTCTDMEGHVWSVGTYNPWA